MSQKVAFIGTGQMGAPMANCLLTKGYTLAVNNRTKSKAQALIDGRRALGRKRRPRAAAGAEIVFTCLPDIVAIEQALFGPGGVCEAKGVVCVVDFSTSGPKGAAAIGEKLEAKGIGFVDAPITGGVPRAKLGTLTVIASGKPESIEYVTAACGAVGTSLYNAGPKPGQAQTVKVINNMINYMGLAAAAEGLVFGAKAGIEPKLILDVLNAGTGKNSSTEIKIPKAVIPSRTFNYGSTNYTVDKDLALYVQQSEEMHIPAPMASALLQLWRGWAANHPSEDLTTIFKMYEGWAGVEVK